MSINIVFKKISAFAMNDLFHPPLKIIYQVDSNEAESQINHFYYYDFRKTNFVKLNNLIEENFNNICLISDNIADIVR